MWFIITGRRGAVPYNDIYPLRIEDAHSKSDGVFDICIVSIHFVPGDSGVSPEPMWGSKGEICGATSPLIYSEASPTKRKTAIASAIAVLICNIKPAVPCERKDRNPALARWCPLFCFVLPTSSKPVKGAAVREVCIPQNEVRAPSIYCGSTKSPITNTAG